MRPATPQTDGERLNQRVWAQRNFVRAYAGRTLRVPEVLQLVRHRETLSGRVLELGCGAGRISGYLVEIAREYHGIDLSPAMVSYCRQHYPSGSFEVGDLRALARFAGESYDAVVAGFSVLDVLDDTDRRRVLADIGGLLAPGGLLVMSTHNKAHLPLPRRAGAISPTRDPVAFARHLVGAAVDLYNHRRLRALEHDEGRYALVNDSAHHYALLHYYLDREEQARQFAEAGLEPVECLDGDGRRVQEGETGAGSAELHYVARRSSTHQKG